MCKRVVYVSSTFVDLKEHRAALKSALEKAQYDVECMEKYPAFDERPLNKCLADVARADVYVLVLAHRYGSRPKEGNPERKSITQLEYEEAGRHKDKPRLVFTVDPDFPWRPKWIDQGEDARDLDAFRATVLAHHGVNQFTEPNQLGSLVLQALRASELGSDRVRTREDARDRNWPRPWDFSGYLEQKRRGFVGREWLFDIVRAWHGEANNPQALLILADFGVGKSAFMAELAAGTAGVPIAAHHFCHHDTIETLNPTTFVRSVAAQLAASLPDYKAAVEADPEALRWLDDATRDPASAFERAVVALLTRIRTPAAPRILLVDALDEALDFEATAGGSRRAPTIVSLLAARTQRLPSWLKVLATSRRRQEVLQPIQQAFRCSLLDGEDVRNLNDIRAYVMERCRSGALAGVLMRAESRPSDLANSLSRAEQSGGKFLYVVRVLNDLESGALPINRLRGLPPGLDGFYLDAFERRFPTDADYGVTRRLLAVLCAQREPLSSAQLAAILSTPQVQIQRLLATLEDFLKVRAKRYAFDHLSLSQWLTEENGSGFARGGRFAIDMHSGADTIADWARREFAAGRAFQSDYLARHLGWYLSEQERKASFRQLLFDFRWLDVRLYAAGMDVLLSDWDDLDVTPALEALVQALRHAAHVLRHDGSDWCGPDLLASQILGRLQHRTESEIRGLCVQAAERIRRKKGLRPLTVSLRSTDALLRTLEGHSDWVMALAMLSDGRLASGSHDGTIKLWNPASGVCEATLEGHSGWVSALAMLPDGRLASGSHDKTIKLWNLVSGACEATLNAHSYWVNALAMLPDGRLASGLDDGTIQLWNLANGACEATLEGHRDGVSVLDVLPDGRLVSGSYDQTIKLWNPTSGACGVTLKGHLNELSAPLAMLPDGRLASGSEDGRIQLWNLASGTGEATLEGHRDGVSVLDVLPDGRLASGSHYGTIKLWNPVSGACEVTLKEHSDQVAALAVLSHGGLASGSHDGTIKLWNLASGACEEMLEGHSDGVMALAILSDGRLASGSKDGTIKLWNPASGACEATLEGHLDGVMALVVLPGGRLALGSHITIKLWNPVSGALDEETFEEHRRGATALVMLADGRLASKSNDGAIKLWNLSSGACEATLKRDSDAWAALPALAVLADGRLASGRGRTIELWNPVSGACEATLEGHSNEVTALAVLADGRLASGSYDRTIKLWNLASGACEATFEGHSNKVTALAVLADGRLVSGSADKSIRIWEPRDQRRNGSVEFIGDADITAIAVAPEASTLLAGDASGRVHFLRIEGAPTGSETLPSQVV